MGVYLSAPVVDKESSDQKCDYFTYGVSSMQGWRMTQEDSHNCLSDFDLETKTSLFAVYDGHGGAEVAKYCSAHLPDFIKTVPHYKEGKLGEALQEAFIGFDATLKEEEVIQQLKVIAGLDDDAEEEEDGDLMGRTETDMLVAEANMPIEELRAKYSSGPVLPQTKRLQKSEKNLSPMIKAKRAPISEGKDGNVEDNKNNSATSTSDPLVTRLEDKLENGQPDNDNNLNVEKELREAVSQSDDQTSDNKNLNDKSAAKVTENVNNNEISEGKSEITKPEVNKVETSESNGEKTVETMEADSTADKDVKSEAAVSSSSASTTSVGAASSGSGETGSSCSVSSSSSGPSGSGSAGPSGSGVQAGGSGMSSGPSGSSEGSSSTKGKKTIADEEFDSDDDSSEEEEYVDESEEDEDDEEDEEDEDDGEQGGIFGTRAVSSVVDEEHNEEPGSDSGCTAVLALIRDDQIVVANAGDSRCVLCRGGKAVELSFDHKPEDESERTRIEAAGGEVTNEGRVNGGLNLSRALGDHWYKRREDLEAKEQMISAFPDIETATLGPSDEFLVVACDGIWNFLTSQEVVDFVGERMKDPEKRKKPSLICEEMFDHCLAPNTMGDGTGCDNMTCIIIVFNKAENSSKRELDLSSSDEQQQDKRPKLDADEVATTDT